jgi:biopolymer transport protein ExbB
MSHVRQRWPIAWVLVLLAVAADLDFYSAALWAQQSAPSEKTAAAATSQPAASGQAATLPAKRESLEATAEPLSIGRVLLEKTNWLGWCFYAAEGTLSIMALSCALERMFNLRRRKLMPPRFVRRLRDLLARREDTAENLLSLCEGSESPIAGILRAGVLRAGRPLPEVEKAIEDAVLRESIVQRGRNRMLGVIAAIAPMVGLLGTVVGMILAFRVTSQAGTGKAELLAEGIYLALLRTAFGLVIAVPSLYLAHFFNNRLERSMRDMVDILEDVVPTFAALERGPDRDQETHRHSPSVGRVK